MKLVVNDKIYNVEMVWNGDCYCYLVDTEDGERLFNAWDMDEVKAELEKMEG